MDYQLHVPGRPLAHYVDYLWSLSDAPSHAQERVLPSGTFELVLNLADDEFRIYGGVEPCRRLGGAIVSGPYVRPFGIDTREHASVVGAHFKPGGALPFLTVPPGAIGGAHVDLAALWGRRAADELRERLASADSSARRFAVLEKSLTAHLPRRPGHPAVPVALCLLARPGATVRRVAEHLELSSRRLEEVFRAEVGMSPRPFARIRRFQRALALAGRPAAPRWGALALAAGYFDQSHLIRDFVELSGFSPERLIARATVPVKENHVALA
jgi:AraC-like DNA-binding protein